MRRRKHGGYSNSPAPHIVGKQPKRPPGRLLDDVILSSYERRDDVDTLSNARHSDIFALTDQDVEPDAYRLGVGEGIGLAAPCRGLSPLKTSTPALVQRAFPPIAFNTMIGQVTSIAITDIGYRYYFVFIICNFTNAVFLWLLLPETKKLLLEEMNHLFSISPWIVPGIRKEDYMVHDSERRVVEQEEKQHAYATRREK